MIRLLRAAELSPDGVVAALARPPAATDPAALARVAAIVDEVRRRGDGALLDFTKRFDGVDLRPDELRVSETEWAAATVSPPLQAALVEAARRVEAFHRHQLPRSWWVRDEHGSLARPAGDAARAGRVLRARRDGGVPVHGADEPDPGARGGRARTSWWSRRRGADGRLPPAVLVAAREAGATEVYRMGGAQAVAALAYGTETLPAVDKIVGPGNLYVALAKRLVFGDVGIDLIAGPSEVVVVADATAEAELVAADLLAQAEHDTLARAVCLTDDAALAARVVAAVGRLCPTLPRAAIAEAAIRGHGAVVVTRDLGEALAIANRLAPEHLELAVADPFAWLPAVRHAGAIFLGVHTPEVVGDYLAGPNHVLPTAATARFASGLSVEDFIKRSSLIHYTPAGLRAAWPHLAALTEAEGLHGHGEAARLRLEGSRTRGDD